MLHNIKNFFKLYFLGIPRMRMRWDEKLCKSLHKMFYHGKSGHHKWHGKSGHHKWHESMNTIAKHVW